MTKQEKKELVVTLTEKLKNSENFYVADASHFTVAQNHNFRAVCHKAGLELKFVKNSLIKKALENLGSEYAPLIAKIGGSSSSIIFGATVPKVPAQAMKDFGKTNEKLKLKGAAIGTDLYIGHEQLEFLASIKTKTELLGELVGLLNSPASRLVSALLNQPKMKEAEAETEVTA